MRGGIQGRAWCSLSGRVGMNRHRRRGARQALRRATGSLLHEDMKTRYRTGLWSRTGGQSREKVVDLWWWRMSNLHWN